MVDVLGQRRVEIAERVVRQAGEMEDRIEAIEVVHRDVTDVLADRGDTRRLDRVATERRAGVQVCVESDDLMAFGHEHRANTVPTYPRWPVRQTRM